MDPINEDRHWPILQDPLFWGTGIFLDAILIGFLYNWFRYLNG